MKITLMLSLLLFISLASMSQMNLVGEKAPKIDVQNWIYPKIQVSGWNTKTVPQDLTGKTIVLDFWFTKCAPCVASIPELNHLARQFPDVLFLSVTFDEPDVIDAFLDKMVMYYPIASDPEQKIINAFGVKAFPQTFFIDKDGIIQWHGSPFSVDEYLIQNLLGNNTENNSISLQSTESPSENAAYSFNLQKHTLEMGQSSYFHFNPYDINVFNKDLENILKVFYGINKSRILTRDSALLHSAYDFTLKADKEITTTANCVEMLKYLLPEQVGFELKEVVKDTIVHVLSITNDSLLNAHVSTEKYFITSMRYDNWESAGATIVNLIDFLEDNYSKLLYAEHSDKRKFDFILPANNFNNAVKILEKEYGLTLTLRNEESTFWEIINKNPE